MATKDEAPQIQVFETSLRIKVEVSVEEKDQAASKLADATELHNQLLAERKATVSDYNERISQQRGIMSAEAKTVKYGMRQEETAVNVEFDRQHGLVRYIRLEDGELVNGEDWRPATDKERALADAMLQEPLPGMDEGLGDPEDEVGGLDTEE